MTLVLTCMTPEFIVQVSDRRLTGPDGKVCDDRSNKACTFCRHFMFAYTGLAELGPRDFPDKRGHTDVWLASTLHEGPVPTAEAFNNLAQRASEEVRRYQSLGDWRGTAFVAAGWGLLRATKEFAPGIFVISNFMDARGRRFDVRDEFEVTGVRLNPSRRFQCFEAGVPTTKSEQTRTMRELRNAIRRGAGAVALVLANTVTAVAARSRRVGRDLMVGIVPKASVPFDFISVPLTGVPPPDEAAFMYLTPARTETWYIPNMACPGGLVMWGGQYSSKPLPPPGSHER